MGPSKLHQLKSLPTPTMEKYLKAILQVGLKNGSALVSPMQLMRAVGRSRPTVGHMINTLSDSGFVQYQRNNGVTLTDRGREVATRILRRHRLIETFLLRVLHLTWDQVNTEADKWESAVSDFLIEKMNVLLDSPIADPHGDPIPSADATFPATSADVRPLGMCRPGSRVQLVRVLNQQPEFLRYLSSCGLDIGVEVVVESARADAGTITLRLNSKPLVLGRTAADQLLMNTS